MAAPNSLAISSGSQLDMTEVFQSLESSERSVVEEAVTVIRDQIGSLVEPNVLNGLVDYYIQSGNTNARDLLCMVRQQQYKTLMNKVDDYLKNAATRLKGLALFGHLVRSEPIWTHCIPQTKAFHTILKSLQIDTDLPTITSALYIIATLLPKVASQVPASLSHLCGIYVRLVSWHTIKPTGANEINLIHLHAAVYALFLCLYGMYPCYFLKYLQQQFQPSSSTRGMSDKARSQVFENSILPMLDHVRLHPRLVTDSTELELSSEKWRRLEGCDILGDISKISLDPTENPAVKENPQTAVRDDRQLEGPQSDVPSDILSRAMAGCCISDAGPCISDDHTWSPSVTVGLSTPPRGISPNSSASQLAETADQLAASEEASAKRNNRPSSLNMSATDGFIPNRPHQTSSSTSTPLRQGVPPITPTLKQVSSFFQSPSLSNTSVNRSKSDSKLEIEEPSSETDGTFKSSRPDLLKQTNQDDSSTRKALLSAKSSTSSAGDLLDTPGKLEAVRYDISADDAFAAVDAGKADSAAEISSNVQTSADGAVDQTNENLDRDVSACKSVGSYSAQEILQLAKVSRYAEKTPNECLDLHVQLMADAYFKRNDTGSSSRDTEWMQVDLQPKPSHDDSYLRSQVIQMHCAMLYERHRREQHSMRARKLMRKVYDTAALEEKNRTLTLQAQELERDYENCRQAEQSHIRKLKSNALGQQRQIEKLSEDVTSCNATLQRCEQDLSKSSADKEALIAQREKLMSIEAHLNSRVFTLEQLNLKLSDGQRRVDDLESKVSELRDRLLLSGEDNKRLEKMLRDVRGRYKTEVAEVKMISDAYARELETVKTTATRNKTKVEFLASRNQQLEREVQEKEALLAEQKKHSENARSLARGQIKAVESKYNGQKQISQRLEMQVMELFSRLVALEGEMAPEERTRLTSGPLSIQSLSASETMDKQTQPLSASPQLSPPSKTEATGVDRSADGDVKSEVVRARAAGDHARDFDGDLA